MNLIEIAGLVGAVGGAIIGASVGFSLYEWTGLVLGIPIGLIGGSLILVALVLFMFFMGIQKEKLHQRWKLKSIFGRYWSKSKREQWNQLSSNINCREKVKGRVVCKFYYGVFLDTNHGFPALLMRYQMIDDFKSLNIDDSIEVCIKGLDNEDRIIEVSQKLPKLEG